MKFSIIIPTYNSEKYLEQCLDSVFKIDYPAKDYEVIIVDSGSKDKTLNIIKKYEKIILIKIDERVISKARNICTKKANAPNLFFIDSDCLVDEKILRRSEINFKKYSCFGAFYKPARTHGIISKTWLLVESKKEGLVDWVPAGTFVVKKDLFDKGRGFNESLETGEDFDICQRIRKKGYKIYNDPKIASQHLGQTDNLKDFFKKEMWRGNSLIKGIKEHGLNKEELPSTIITAHHSILILFFPASIFFGNKIIALTTALILFPTFLLTIRKVIQTKKISQIHNIFIIILIYQIARAVSLIKQAFTKN